jgi:small GTP-binding protein
MVTRGKAVFIGESEVGKTSLIQAYAHDSSAAQATVAGQSHAFKVDTLEGLVELDVWDTPGTQNYRTLVPLFFHHTNVAVLVYSKADQKSFDALAEWWKLLNDNPVRRVILVENKADLSPIGDGLPGQTWADSHQTEHLGAKFPIPFLQTSVRTGQLIPELFRTVADLIQEEAQPILPEPKAKIGGEWKVDGCSC